ncbi:hypothetical protein ABIA27_001171 [Sinorhizobium fredii]
MNHRSDINDMTDDELREICMLAIGVCATDEAMDESLPPFWGEVLKEVLARRPRGDNQRDDAGNRVLPKRSVRCRIRARLFSSFLLPTA